MAIQRAEFLQPFEIEALEPRIMLSADGLGPAAGAGSALAEAGARVELLAHADDFQHDALALVDSDAGSDDFGQPDEHIALADETIEATWINAAGGNWSDSANWQDGHVPVAGDDVVIAGLNGGASITLTGDTATLASLSIDGSTVTINGALNTAALAVTNGGVLHLQTGASTVTGDASFDADTSFELQSGATLTWSGATWQQGGFAHVTAGTTFTQGAGVLTTSGTAQFAVNGTYTMTGGELVVPATGALNFYNNSAFNATDAIVTLEGGVLATLNQNVTTFSNSVLQGTGTVRLNQQLDFVDSTLRPGGMDTAGALNVIYGEDETSGTLNFSGAWAIELEVFDATTFDTLSIQAAVSFGADGAIDLDASAADFGATATGTALGDLITITGTGVTSADAAVQITTGADHTVTAAWSSDILSAQTYSPLTARWIAAAGGDWSDTANWANGRLPGAGDDVVVSGLNNGAVITLTGDTPVLQSLAVEAGTLSIDGALSTATLTVAADATLDLSGTGTSTISGAVTIAAGATIELGDTAVLIWSGAVGNDWTHHGTLGLANGTELRATSDAAFRQYDGLVRIDEGAQFNVTHLWGNLFIHGGEFRVNGEFRGTGGNAEFILYAGTLSGGGIVANVRTIQLKGAVSPGSAAGETAWLQFSGDVAFSGDAWSVRLEILNAASTLSSSFDIISVTGDLSFAGAGAITLDATAADFTGHESGETLGDSNGLFYAHGAVTGDAPTVITNNGEIFGVAGSWSGTQLQVTLTVVVVDDSGSVVVDGLTAASVTVQGLLAGFDLSAASFAVPTLPTALDDLFDLDALTASLALPSITGATDLASTLTALQNAGYTVDTSVEGVDFVATLTRTIADDRAQAAGFDTAWVEPADLFDGFADNASLTAALNLFGTLIQHVVFELRDGVFNLLSDTYLSLALAGGATFNGTIRQGGRTVNVTGSTVVGAEVRVHHGADGATTTGQGTVDTSFSATSGPLALTYGRDYGLDRDLATLVTSIDSTPTLNARLTLAEVAGGNLDLVGTLAGDGQSWTLAGAGNAISWLGFDVAGWSFDVDLSATTFNGSGSFDTALDILSNAGVTPEVSFGATFDQDELTFTGTLSSDLIAVANPAGGSYLSIVGFNASASVTGDLDAGTWSGELTFSGGETSFGPAGASFTATITDGDDADAHAVTGSYDFATQAFTTTADQFEMVAENIVRVTAAGVVLRHQRDVTDEQELVKIDEVTVELLFLTSAPSTGPPSLPAADLSIRTNGITLGAGSLSNLDLSIGSALTLSGASVSFAGFSFLDGASAGDSVTLAAASATLFPGNATFTATATGLSGTYDFSSTTDRLALSADAIAIDVGERISFSATEVVLRPEGDTVFAAATIEASLSGLGVSGTLSGLELAADGSLAVTALALDTSGLTQTLRLGGLLPFSFGSLEVAFLGDTNDNGVRDAGETFNLGEFDLTVAGTFDFGVLAGLPFTPVIRIGEQSADDGADSVSFTLRHSEGGWRPWDLGPIEIGVSELNVGDSFSFSGSIMLGGYAEGEWVADFGGTLSLAAGSAVGGLSGGVAVTITGSIDEAAGVLDLSASFTVSFTLGDYVSVTDASLGFVLSVSTVAGEGSGFTLSVDTFALTAGSIARASVTFGDLLALEATGATFNFTATGDEALIRIASLTADLSGVGLSGTASNFALGADLLPIAGEDFTVSFSFGPDAATAIQWPEWLPIQVSVFELNWEDLRGDPLDFTLRLSASVSAESVSGSTLTFEGAIENLIIDVGALKSGAFPIIGLGEVAIAVGGKIASAEVSAGLVLGIVRLDAAGNPIADEDTTTEVADGVLWGAVRGSINIAGYGGLEVFLGLSEFGPLQGYVKATVPITIPKIGISFTDFRAGITFNSTLPAIEDPLELQEHPEFTPTGDLSFAEWREVLETSLANQIAAHAEAGNFGVLLNPFVIEGGVTIFSIYVSTATFNIQADFKMDSTGKFLARGAFQVGGTINFTANLYIDMSTFVTEGDGTVLFLAELPSELPVATIYGLLSFDFGETVDPDNPPAAPFEQFTIRLAGGARLQLAGIPGFVLEGSVAFEVALNAPSLRVIVDGRAAMPFLGDVIGLAGDFHLFFAEDETVAAAGILALAPADFAVLQTLGVTMDALALLRFNTTSAAIDHTLDIAGQDEPRTFTLAAGEASILVEGLLGLAPAGVELFRLGGVFSMTWTPNGFDVLAAAELTAGPVAAPLLRFGAEGYLHFEIEGITPGLAAQLALDLDPNDDVLAALGLELDGHYQFIMNTTGEDVDFTLPTEFAATAAVERIHLPRGPPSADGETVGAAGAYLIVRATGTLNVLDLLDMEGVFDFQVAAGQVQLDYEATVRLGVGAVTFYEYHAAGVFRIDAAGVYGQADLSIDATVGLPALALGFAFDATWQLQINTTNAVQTLGDDVTLAAGHYARVRADGALIVGAWRFVGTYDLTAAVDGVSAQAAGSVSLGIGEVEFASFDFAGALLIRDDGIFAQLALSQSRSAPAVYGFGFSAEAGYELSLNTTGDEIDGVAAGLGARIVVTGALEIGNWQIDGVYTLNATTTGIGFAASAALIFKAGDDELFRVPLAFEIELDFPGIVEQIDLSLSLEDLGITIPGLELSGAAQVVINTTAETQGEIPAGPILRFTINGQAVIGGLALDGTFGFESTLGGVTMFGDFAANLGPAGDPLLSFTGTGEFELTLLGVAAYAELSLTGGDPTFTDFFGADFNYFVEFNTRPIPYTLGERTLPAGPTVRIGAAGTFNVLGYAFAGTYTLAAGGAGVDITMDATASVTLDTLTLISFSAVGGLHLGLDGLVAAFDITPDLVDFSAVGLELDTDAGFALRINTTGAEQTIADLTLEAGTYARVLFTSSLTYGVFRFDGAFSLSVVDDTAELLLDTQMIVELPAIAGVGPTELFRMGASGGLRIAPEGVVAAFELDRGALDALTLFDVSLPIGVSQTFVLHFNTTGSEQTLGDLTLAAGRYLKVVTTGEAEIGPGRVSGLFSLEAGETGLELVFDADYFLGIPGTEISLFRYQAQGGLSIKANGIAGAVILNAPVGLAGLDTLGLAVGTLGLDQVRMLRVNTTGEEVTLGDVVLEAGHYLEVYSEDTLSIGVVSLSGSMTFRADEHGLLLAGDLNLTYGLPEIPGAVDRFDLYSGGAEIEVHLTPGGLYGMGRLYETIGAVSIGGVDLTPSAGYAWILTINTTTADQTVGDDIVRAGSFSVGAVISFGLLGQTIEGNVVFTIDSANRVIGGLVRGSYDVQIGDWNPLSFEVTGFVLLAEAGVAMDYDLALTGGEGIPGITLDVDWNLRVSTFAEAGTLEAYSAGGIEIPGLVFDEGSIFRIQAAGTLAVGDNLFDGSFLFEVADGTGLFDTSLTLAIDATLRLQLADTTLLAFDVVGGLSVSVDGIWGGFAIALATDGLETTFGFDLDASYRLELNTTGSAQTVGELALPAGPYARVQAQGKLVVGALQLEGTYGFAVGVDGIAIDSIGSVSLGVAGLTFYTYNYEGQFILDASGLYASLSLSVGSSNRDQYGFGFGADATYTLGINTTHTERDGIPPGLGARVRVEGNLEIGDISMAGVYDLTATTTGIGFAASAALVLRADDTVLLEIPVAFSYELVIPGIVDEIALDVAAEDLGIEIPGLDFAGEAAIVINTTGLPQGDIPAGPLLQLAVNGTATVGDLELAGRFGFESSLNQTRMITSFSYALGDENDPLLSFSATGAFNLGLDGIAGLFDLEITGGDAAIRDVLGADLTYQLVVNTTAGEYELFDRTLPAGPLYQIEAHGDLAVAGLTLSGDYLFRIDGTGLLIETESTLDLSIPDFAGGEDLQLFAFDVDGGLAITRDGVATALDLTPTYASLEAFGLTLGLDGAYALAINTTGTAFTFGDVELEAGVYARVENRGTISFGIATMTGLFRFEADTAGVFEMQAVSELELNIPGLGELARFSYSGGFRFDATGVIAAIDLERSAASERIEVGGVTLPFKAEQSFLLRLNTTNQEREIAGVTLEAGHYFAIHTVGEIDFGIVRSGGPMSLVVEGHELDIRLDQEAWVGIPGTEITLFEATMTGSLHLGSDGVYGAINAQRHVGAADAGQLGLNLGTPGAGETMQLRINSTGDTQQAGEVTLDAGPYIEVVRSGNFFVGVAAFEGRQRFYAGAQGVVLDNVGTVSLGLPAAGDFEGFTLFEAAATASFTVTGDGVWGLYALTRSTEAISVAGVNITPDFDAGIVMAINTTTTARTVNDVVISAESVRIAGAMAFDFLGAHINGQVALTVDWDQGFGVYAVDGSASIGIGDWQPFVYDAEGFILIGEAGAATNFDLSLAGGAGVPGVDFDGTWSLRASTMSTGVTVAPFSASGIDVPEISIEAGNLLRTHLDGSISVGGLAIEGEFDFAITPVEFAVQSTGAVSFFGVSATFDGTMYIHPDRGFVANVAMSWGGIDNAFMKLGGEAFLRINTWSGGTWEDVAANTAEIGINNGLLRLGFTELRGWAAFQWTDGQARLWADMDATLLPGMDGHFNGFISSSGAYDLNGSFTLAMGVSGVAGAFGTLQANLNHQTGLTGTVSGRLDVPGGDYGNLSGSFAMTADEARLTVDQTAFVLLGGLIRVDGGFGVTLTDGLLTIWVNDAVASSRVPGWDSTFRINGWINSLAQFDLNGAADLALGVEGVAGAFGEVAVNLSPDKGISGALTGGRLYVPGGDWAGLSGSFVANSREVTLNIDKTAFVLLGGLVRVDGGFGVTLRDGLFTVWVDDAVASTRVPGWNTTITIDGWLNSKGQFDLHGTTSLDIGNAIVGAEAEVDVRITQDGFAGSYVGTVYVPGDYGSFSGSLVADSSGFDLTGSSRFVLLGGAVLLDGNLQVRYRNSLLEIAINRMTAESRIPGWSSSFTVDGYINSNGTFDLTGTANIDVGTSTLGLDGSINLRVANTGISGSISGTLYVPGDYSSFSGSFSAGTWGFDVSASSRFVLVGGLVLLDGGFGIEMRSGRLTVHLNDIRVQSRVPGWSSSFTVDGHIRSDGDIYLVGTADLDVGNSTLGAEVTIDVVIRDEGISGDVWGRLYVPGDYADYSGTFAADSGGFDLTVDARFALLGALVVLDGGVGISHRGGTLTFTFEDIAVETRIPGWSTDLTVDGYIRSNGDFFLTGTTRLDIGNSTLGVDTTVTLTIRDEGIAGSLSGRLYIPGDYADFSGSFEAGTWGFNVTVDRARFVLLGGAVLLDGSMILEQRGSSLRLYVQSMTAELRLPGFSQTFGISGSFNTAGGFDLTGTARLDIGSSHVGATGDVTITIDDLGIRGSIRGTVYVPGDYAGFSGSFSADANGFEINISRVRFVVLGGTLLIDGSLRLLSRNGGLYISVPGAMVEMWGLRGSISGYFDSTNGHWRVDGSLRFRFGGSFGAEGTIYVDVGHDRANARASGKAWAQAEYWFFGWRTYRDYAYFDARVNLGDGRIDVRMKFWKFYVTVHVRLRGGFRVWLSDVGGSTVFLDVNRNGALDEGEPFTLTDANGNFDFAAEADPESEGNDPLEGEAPEFVATLGRLAAFDADGDGVLTAAEIQLYAVNGISGSEDSDFRRLYRDENGNGEWDEETEVALDVSFDELSALTPGAMTVAGTIFEVFDENSDGILSDAEAAALSLELIGVRVPLTLLPTEVTGGVSVKDAEFVFADANGNGVYDAGEPTATPDEFGIYTFLEGADAAPTASLGRLAPFDTNANGRIDSSEGVFVVLGGTDNDNGMTNPVAATALAENYGGGIEQTINPLTSLQVALVDRGLTIDEAADMIEDAFDLPRGVDVDSFDPDAETSGDASAEGAALGAGAMVTSLVTGGAGLLGNDADANLQDAVLDQLADTLLADANDGDGQVGLDLTHADTLAAVIRGAGARTGRTLDETVANAAGTVLADVNRNVAETVAAGGNVSRALAANKAVFLGGVNAGLRDLGQGTVSADDLQTQFSDEALDDLQADVVLTPTIAPTLGEVADQITLGANVSRITLAVTDADSRASELSFSVTSSDESVVAADEVSFEYNNGEWIMFVPTAAATSGSTVLSVTVSDGDAVATSAFTLALDGLNPVVQVVAGVPNQTLAAGQSVALNLGDIFADPNGDASYSLVALATNNTVDAAIVNGQLVLTARTDLSGLEVFDLVATDSHGTASIRFSVVTYPTVTVSDQVRRTADGRIEIDVTLSNPATQSLTLRYNLAANDPAAAGPLSGRLTFAPGVTKQTLSIDAAASGLGDVRVHELAFGVSGAWTSGSFGIEINNRNPAELLDLQRRVSLTFDFTAAYDFVIAAEDEESLPGYLIAAAATIDYESASIESILVESQAPRAGSDLARATSLKALETPRSLAPL